MKNWLFRQWWRINRARGVLSIAFWILTLVGVWAPYLQRYAHVSMSLALGVSFTTVLVAIFALGYMWDKLQLWHYETRENMRRTYTAYYPTPKERTYAWPLHLAVARNIYRMTKDPELAEAIQRLERWLKDVGDD